LAILGQKSLDRFENTFLVQKKLISIFVTKGQRVNRVIKLNTPKITPPKDLRRTRVNIVI
jgi:hypothetical protein